MPEQEYNGGNTHEVTLYARAFVAFEHPGVDKEDGKVVFGGAAD